MDATFLKFVHHQERRRSRNTMATRTRVRLAADRCKKTPLANDSIFPRTDNAAPGRAAKFDPGASWPRSFGWGLIAVFRAEPQVVHEQAEESADHRDIAEPLQWALPQFHHQRN